MMRSRLCHVHAGEIEPAGTQSAPMVVEPKIVRLCGAKVYRLNGERNEDATYTNAVQSCLMCPGNKESQCNRGEACLDIPPNEVLCANPAPGELVNGAGCHACSTAFGRACDMHAVLRRQ
jgi:hypothetical protein